MYINIICISHQEKRGGAVAGGMSEVSEGAVGQWAIGIIQGVCEGEVILWIDQKAQIRTKNPPDNPLYLENWATTT